MITGFIAVDELGRLGWSVYSGLGAVSCGGWGCVLTPPPRGPDDAGVCRNRAGSERGHTHTILFAMLSVGNPQAIDFLV